MFLNSLVHFELDIIFAATKYWQVTKTNKLSYIYMVRPR